MWLFGKPKRAPLCVDCKYSKKSDRHTSLGCVYNPDPVDGEIRALCKDLRGTVLNTIGCGPKGHRFEPIDSRG